MKQVFSFSIFVAFVVTMFAGAFAFAQDFPAPTTTQDVITALADLIGGTKGATTLAIVALVGQLLAKFVLSPLWDSLQLDVKYKFLVFAIANLVGAVVPLMIQGQSFISAISGGAVLLLIVQYGHRIYELFFEKKEAAA